MVRKRTVLVLGAGASLAYGFPLGAQLKQQIARSLVSHAPESPASVITGATGAPLKTIEAFRSDLERSNAASVDAFIEEAGGEVYDTIARAAIALELLQLESDERLRPTQGDWYALLFDSVLRDPVSFRENFKIVTFNFDRSYERRLYHELSRRLAGTPLADDVYFDDVYFRLVHVHGSLGHPTWQRLYIFGGGMMREYVPSVDAARVAHAARNVRIYRDAITDGQARAIRDCLQWAERVFFIGLGYHPSNLHKLGVPETLVNKDVRGTVFGLDARGVGQMRELTGGLAVASPPHWGALEVVQECECFANRNGEGHRNHTGRIWDDSVLRGTRPTFKLLNESADSLTFCGRLDNCKTSIPGSNPPFDSAQGVVSWSNHGRRLHSTHLTARLRRTVRFAHGYALHKQGLPANC